MLTVAAIYFSQLAFDHALTGCVTVSFFKIQLGHALTGELPFLFQLAFDYALIGCSYYSFFELAF